MTNQNEQPPTVIEVARDEVVSEIFEEVFGTSEDTGYITHTLKPEIIEHTANMMIERLAMDGLIKTKKAQKEVEDGEDI